jgi:apolipoprotein N-acyltransferase
LHLVLTAFLKPLFWFLNGVLLACAAPGIGLSLLAWVGLIPVLSYVVFQEDLPFKTRLLFSASFWFGFNLLYFAWFTGLHPLYWVGLNTWQSMAVSAIGWMMPTLSWTIIHTIAFLLISKLFRVLPVHFRYFMVILGPGMFWAVQNLGELFPLAAPWAYLEYTQAHSAWMRELAGTISGRGVGCLIFSYNISWALLLHFLLYRVYCKFNLKQALSRSLSLSTLALITVYTASSALPLLFFVMEHRISPIPGKKQSELPFHVLQIQGNLSIETIRDSNKAVDAARKYYWEPIERKNLPENSLVVLPEEGVATEWINIDDPLASSQLKRLQAVVNNKKLFLVTCLLAYQNKPCTRAQQQCKPNAWNAMALLSPHQPVQFYFKRVLVPFGETTPFVDGAWLAQQLALLHIDYAEGFQKGALQQPLFKLKLSGKPLVKASPLVCFELIYPQLSLNAKRKGANVLINSSNLGWFHDHPWMEAQFKAIAQMRAAENHLPVIISANTGPTAYINGKGAVLD